MGQNRDTGGSKAQQGSGVRKVDSKKEDSRQKLLASQLDSLGLGKASRTVKINSVLITLREPGNVKLRFVVAATTLFVIQKSALSES
jgi:hypothetical protein